MWICCIIVLLVLTIFYWVTNSKKSGFFPERVNVCEEAAYLREKKVDPVEKKCAALYDYNLGNSLNARIDDDCKIRDLDFVVNPLTMIYSNKPERLMFSNNLFALWPTNQYYLHPTSEGLEYYDPSCVNVGMKKCTRKLSADNVPYTGDPVNKLHLGDCINEQIKEKFESRRGSTWDRQFFSGEGTLEDDVRFPHPIPGEPSSSSEFSPLSFAGGRMELGFMPSKLAPDGKFGTEYVELDDRLKRYNCAHGNTQH